MLLITFNERLVLKNLLSLAFITLFSVVFCLQSTHASTVTDKVLSTPELIETLQAGGHIIYMRHSITDRNQNDSDRQNLEDCSTQRNLSTEGIEQATQIGLKIQSIGIPIGKVLSSPYCRCKDTAKLVFGHYEIEPDLVFSMSKNKVETEALAKKLYNMMLNTENDSDNAVFVGHTSNLRDGLSIWPKPEGVVVIFKKINNEIEYKGMIKPTDWPDEY